MEKQKRTRRTKAQMEAARNAEAAQQAVARKPKYLSKHRRAFEVSAEDFAKLRTGRA